VQITARPQQENVPWFVSLLVSWLPFIALIGVWIFLSRQMQGAGGKALGFGKSRAKLLTEAHGRVTFEDVAGQPASDRTCNRGALLRVGRRSHDWR
jgi:cell division protease FtsH